MVAIAGAIIKQRTGAFDPGTYRDRYQEALRELIEAKLKGITVTQQSRERIFPTGDRRFESVSLQQRIRCKRFTPSA
jgi:non-homologous end joining protein Ku